MEEKKYEGGSGGLDKVIRVFFFQAEDSIRDLVRSRGLGDVYRRQFLGRGPWFSAVELRS